MKNQLMILIILLATLVPAASADIVNDLDIKVNEYNEYTEQVPSFLKTLLGNEVIKLVIMTNEGEEVYIKAVTEDAFITTFEEIDENTQIDETMIVGTDEETIQNILSSEDPLGTFIDAKENGKIIIKPVGIVNNVTFTMANVILKLSQFLGLA